MKLYFYKDRRTGDRVYWTRRDANGVCWEIRNQFLRPYRLYRCGDFIGVFDTLEEAQAAVETFIKK